MSGSAIVRSFYNDYFRLSRRRPYLRSTFPQRDASRIARWKAIGNQLTRQECQILRLVQVEGLSRDELVVLWGLTQQDAEDLIRETIARVHGLLGQLGDEA